MGTEPEQPLVSEREFSNEELALALLSIALRYEPHSIRCGAAMLSAAGNDPRRLARMAVMERSVVPGAVRVRGRPALRAGQSVLDRTVGGATQVTSTQIRGASASHTLHHDDRIDAPGARIGDRMAAAPRRENRGGSVNAERILQAVDSHLDHEVSLVIYGRAAIALGFANPPSSPT